MRPLLPPRARPILATRRCARDREEPRRSKKSSTAGCLLAGTLPNGPSERSGEESVGVEATTRLSSMHVKFVAVLTTAKPPVVRCWRSLGACRRDLKIEKGPQTRQIKREVRRLQENAPNPDMCTRGKG